MKEDKQFIHKYSILNLNQLKKRLSEGKDYYYYYLQKKDKITLKTQIGFWRLDIIPELKKRYKKETYVLGVERGDARWVLEEGNLMIDERKEFHTVEEIIQYLDEMDYLKKEEWIKEPKKVNKMYLNKIKK